MGLTPGLAWWVKILAAVAPIRPRAWESPYAVGAVLKRQKTKKKKKKKVILYNKMYRIKSKHIHGY